MTDLKRDILLTLTLKLSLLFLLWFVCFKPIEKEVIDPQNRFMGASHSKETHPIAQPKSNKIFSNHQTTEVDYDSWS